VKVGIVGSGNIGLDLMYKLQRQPRLELVGVAGRSAASSGLALARSLGYTTTHEGLERLLDLEPGIELVFDSTSAKGHYANFAVMQARGIQCVNMTPALTGPKVVPVVNMLDHLDAPAINLITCGAQAVTPIVAAISRVAHTTYAEIVATLASKSAGPGTRQNIDEYTIATAEGLVEVGGADKGKAIIILNPAEPPIMMRNTVHARVDGGSPSEFVDSIDAMVAEVARYVPGYRLRARPIFRDDLVTVFIEVEGAGDYLPKYAGNLDIMTSAGIRIAEFIEQRRGVAA
jgi:acetaldehyde dehydrogenase (acetylating)